MVNNSKLNRKVFSNLLCTCKLIKKEILEMCDKNRTFPIWKDMLEWSFCKVLPEKFECYYKVFQYSNDKHIIDNLSHIINNSWTLINTTAITKPSIKISCDTSSMNNVTCHIHTYFANDDMCLHKIIFSIYNNFFYNKICELKIHCTLNCFHNEFYTKLELHELCNEKLFLSYYENNNEYCRIVNLHDKIFINSHDIWNFKTIRRIISDEFYI